jgi:hypothetical protein
MSPSFPSGNTTGIVTTSLPYGVLVWHTCFLARNWADLSYVAGKPSCSTVFSNFAMPDLLTKDALPNDINSKLLASELFNLFFGGGSMGEWVATLSASGSAQPLRGFFEPAGCNESDGIAHSVRAEVHNHDDVSMASHTHSVRAQWDAQSITQGLLATWCEHNGMRAQWVAQWDAQWDA